MVDRQRTQSFVNDFWEQHIVPPIIEYIRIPNKSPSFDSKWETAGHMDAALKLAKEWIDQHPLPGAKVTIDKVPGRTPIIMIDVPGQIDKTVLLYGHLDKQPEMTGWREGLGPWIPVREGDKLYGRGGADDGYALFASVCALKAMHDQGIPHARAVILIEFSEESGSPDLPFYVDRHQNAIGEVDLVVCLDSGAGNYDQLWSTTSLRGLVGVTLRVDVLTEGVHSGDASGIVPSSFRVLRQLVSRLEDPETGTVLPAKLKVEIPQQRVDQAQLAAKSLGDDVFAKFPFLQGMSPMHKDRVQLVLNRTWRAALSYTGQEGMPPLESSGNVLRPYTAVQLSLRLPPTLNGMQAQNEVARILTEDPPYGAKVSLDFDEPATGWNAPELAPWLDESLTAASEMFYEKPAVHMGEGGTIPFMGMLGEKFPNAQFVITGVLGPNSNAHGPNEFLHIGYAKKLTACVVKILEDHATV
ncbi:MAG: M20 family metallopeptidase [Acidobacteria bacterium]|nr:M20 family metallopeptidase [Acidobacteriota bacterium]